MNVKNLWVFTFLALFSLSTFSAISSKLYEYVDIDFTNTSYSGSPFELIATATYVHQGTNETITSQLFYKGSNTWTARFTGTKTGTWNMTTSSSDSDLDGKTETISVTDNPGAHGFMKQFGDKWGWQGTETAFVPQYVMTVTPEDFHNQSAKIDAHIQTFIVEHGFSGFHFASIAHGWTDITRCGDGGNSGTDPDVRTFEAFELFISKVHAAGGATHIWAWGDASRSQTPPGGINSTSDKKLQRYLAARLGPVPGWSMGYGFDLDEWVNENQLKAWRDYMHQHFGWSHFLGGRHGDPNRGTDHSMAKSWNEKLDYSSYEHHQPPYDVYVAALLNVPGKPVFSEDRFRVRIPPRYPDKDYTEELTRLTLWRSMLAGGVANIFGYRKSDQTYSEVYPNKAHIKTYSVFTEKYFNKNMTRDNSLTDGYCLKDTRDGNYVFYKENTGSLQYNLSGMSGSKKVVAVDAKKAYAEVDLGTKAPGSYTFNAPNSSDWAIAVGESTTAIEHRGHLYDQEPLDIKIQPNPFRPAASIAVDCKMQNAKCKMQIYNLNGRLVETLNGTMGHKGTVRLFRWDAENQAAGIYIAKARINNSILSRKLILQK